MPSHPHKGLNKMMVDMETAKKFKISTELVIVVEAEDNADAMRKVITDAIEMGADVLTINSQELKVAE